MTLANRFITTRPARPPNKRVDFTTNLSSTQFRSINIHTEGMNRLSVEIFKNTDENGPTSDSYTWASAIVEIKWSNDPKSAVFHSFTNAKTLTTSVTALRSISVTGCRWIRLETTTAEGGGDPNAYTVVTVQ